MVGVFDRSLYIYECIKGKGVEEIKKKFSKKGEISREW